MNQLVWSTLENIVLVLFVFLAGLWTEPQSSKQNSPIFLQYGPQASLVTYMYCEMIRMCQIHREDVTISNKFEKTSTLKALLY